MKLDPVKQVALDTVLRSYAERLTATGDELSAVTLAYTHNLHRAWRTVLQLLPLEGRSSVLDVGSGLGVLSFELAANLDVDVLGVDIEPRFVEHSTALSCMLESEGLFSEGASATFRQGDICALPVDEGSVDMVIVRELLQFLPDPVRATAEIHRVLRPGGAACVSDTDDQLHITWPPRPAPLDRLVRAVAEVQHSRGGDRACGRKLTTYLRAVGFGITSVVVLPEASHRVVDGSEGERTLVLQQLRSARSRVVSAGAMTAEAFDDDLAELEAQAPCEEFRMTARIIVLAHKNVS